ncbi:MAG: threonine synthase [Candidatus Omnitrophota bacterium]|nr:MAG: threonine synthase [Candidatus Omnitrophota bacterium]
MITGSCKIVLIEEKRMNAIPMQAHEVRYFQQCIGCSTHYPTDRFTYTCTRKNCGGLLLVERDEDYITALIGKGESAQSHFDSIRWSETARNYPTGSGVFEWRDFILPGFPYEACMALFEGCTDLFEVPQWLRTELELGATYLKLEGQNPSGSFKDRGMSLAVSETLRLQLTYPDLGITGVCCASTGDTSAAAAAYAAYARDKLDCIILVPHNKISVAQLTQALKFGAKVIAVDHPDGFDGCMRIIQQFSASHPELVLVNSKNAFRVAGQETIGLEICQDLRWKSPDWISIPVGNAGNLTALLIGLKRAKKHGLIDRLPGILVGQATVCDTLVRWDENGRTASAYKPGKYQNSVASAANICDPVSFPRVALLIQEFDAHFYRASEEEIQDAQMAITRGGVDICPQTGIALSALFQARADETVKESDTVVVISTATGLKFSESAAEYHVNKENAKYANSFRVAQGSVEAVEAVIKEWG